MAETHHTFEHHEPRGVNVWPVLGAVVGFLLFVALWLTGIYFYYNWSTSGLRPPIPLAFPKPQLQRTPLLNLQTLEARQRSQLEGYAWADRNRGIIRIPIERAMQILAGRGTDAYEGLTIESAPKSGGATNAQPQVAPPASSPKVQP